MTVQTMEAGKFHLTNVAGYILINQTDLPLKQNNKNNRLVNMPIHSMYHFKQVGLLLLIFTSHFFTTKLVFKQEYQLLP
jgi:hypothetical protein